MTEGINRIRQIINTGDINEMDNRLTQAANSNANVAVYDSLSEMENAFMSLMNSLEGDIKSFLSYAFEDASRDLVMNGKAKDFIVVDDLMYQPIVKTDYPVETHIDSFDGVDFPVDRFYDDSIRRKIYYTRIITGFSLDCFTKYINIRGTPSYSELDMSIMNSQKFWHKWQKVHPDFFYRKDNVAGYDIYEDGMVNVDVDFELFIAGPVL